MFTYLPDLKDDQPLPDRILLCTQLPEGTTGGVYEYFLSPEALRIKEDIQSARKRSVPVGNLNREYQQLRQRDLEAVLARFPGYTVAPPSFSGDISLIRTT